MYKMKMSNLHIANTIAIALLLFAVVVVIMPATAVATVSVTRDLPNTAYPGQEINVSLTQSGFFSLGDGGIGTVTETLPEGFKFRGLLSGSGDIKEYENNLTIMFRGETTIIYKVKTGTAEQIAVFSGTYKTFKTLDEERTGYVTGDDKVEIVEEEEPTPTPTPAPTSGNGVDGGSGGTGGATTPTHTPTATVTTTPGETPSPSATAGATVTPSPTASPAETATPSPSPTKKPLIPGFEAVFAIASLLAVAYLVLKRERKA